MAESDSKDEALFRNVVAGLVATAVLAFFVLLVLYLWRFAGEGWSPMQAHWGAFGDYLGGTLNPMLGFASVVLLALTLREQRKQLRELRSRSVVEELQRLIANSAAILDQACKAKSARLVEYAGVDATFAHAAFHLFFRMRSGALSTTQVKELADELWFTEAWDAADRLGNTLIRFLEAGGSRAVAGYYGYCYLGPVLAAAAIWPDPFDEEMLDAFGITPAMRKDLAEARRFSVSLDPKKGDSEVQA